MRAHSSALLCALLLATALAAPLQAQEKDKKAAAEKPAAIKVARKAAPEAAEPTLIFDREVYSYPENSSRDPFMALVGDHEDGPRFDDLSLRGIIYSPAGTSLVLLSDGKKVYRRHRGEMVGNARILQISPTEVIFSVNYFGIWRQESIQLKKNPEGAEG